MAKYDVDEILKKKPLNHEEIEQLKEKAASGNASNYVKRILKKSEELERLHGK